MHNHDPKGRALTPAEALDVLAIYLGVEGEEDDRGAALNDPRVPDSTVDSLLRTLSVQARESALARLERPQVLARWASEGGLEERVVIGFNPYTPPASLHDLAHDPDPLVRSQVLFNPGAQPVTLERLFADPDPSVQEAVETAFETPEGHRLRQGHRTAHVDEDG